LGKKLVENSTRVYEERENKQGRGECGSVMMSVDIEEGIPSWLPNHTNSCFSIQEILFLTNLYIGVPLNV